MLLRTKDRKLAKVAENGSEVSGYPSVLCSLAIHGEMNVSRLNSVKSNGTFALCKKTILHINMDSDKFYCETFRLCKVHKQANGFAACS